MSTHRQEGVSVVRKWPPGVADPVVESDKSEAKIAFSQGDPNLHVV